MWGVIAVAVLVAAGIAIAVHSVVGSSGSKTPSSPGTGASSAGTMFTSKNGHFKARFPSQPTELAVAAQSAGALQVALNGAICSDPMTEVELETPSQAIAADQQQQFMQLALSTLVPSDGLVDDGETQTTYSGHAARSATFNSSNGQQVTALAYFAAPTKMYLLLAGTGTPYKNLVASFQALP